MFELVIYSVDTAIPFTGKIFQNSKKGLQKHSFIMSVANMYTKWTR